MNSEKRLTYTRIPNAKWNIMSKNVPQLVDSGSLEILESLSLLWEAYCQYSIAKRGVSMVTIDFDGETKFSLNRSTDILPF